MKDRRKHPRWQVERSLRIRILRAARADALAGQVFWCTSRDISLEGIRLCCEKPIPVGTLLELSIIVDDLPSEFLQEGRVQWSRRVDREPGYEFGVAFSARSAHTPKAWRIYVEKLLPLSVAAAS